MNNVLYFYQNHLNISLLVFLHKLVLVELRHLPQTHTFELLFLEYLRHKRHRHNSGAVQVKYRGVYCRKILLCHSICNTLCLVV